MTAMHLSRGAACAAAMTIVGGLAACSSPNAGVSNSLQSATTQTMGAASNGAFNGGTSTGGTGTTPTTPTDKTPFPKSGASNAQSVAQPSSALIVYVPADTTQLEYSGPGGHRISVTEDQANGTASVKLDATLIGGRKIVTSASNIKTTDLPIGVSNDKAVWQRVYGTVNSSNYTQLNPATQTQVQVLDLADTGQLTDAKYGIVYVMNGNPWPVNMKDRDFGLAAYHTGNATPLGQMPTNTTATYRGYFQGTAVVPYSVRPGDVLGVLVGDATINANFASGKIDGAISNIQQRQADLTLLRVDPFNINVAGTISGNAYQGTAALSGVGATATGGAVNGAFYGANAAETAGAVSAQGSLMTTRLRPNGPPDPAVSMPMTVIGAYGAKR